MSEPRILREIIENEAKEIIRTIEKFVVGKGSVESINNLGLSRKTNIMKWLHVLLNNNKSDYEKLKESLEYLLNNFTDHMRTRMKEEEKCAVGFVWKDSVFLAHTHCGATTVLIELIVKERLIDPHIIYRFVHFYKDNGEIKVRFYERNRSEFFREWLGLSREDYDYYDYQGQVRLICMAHGSEIEIRLSAEKYLAIIEGRDKDFHIDLNKGEIYLRFPGVLKIVRSKLGKREFKDIKELQKVFVVGGVFSIRDILDVIRKISSLRSFYNNNIVIEDYPREVMITITLKNTNNTQIITKATDDGSYLVFADGEKITIAEEYINELASRFINEEETRILFVPIEMIKENAFPFRIVSHEPLIVGSFKIYNSLSLSKNLRELMRYYNSKIMLPIEVKIILGFTILYLISEELQARNDSSLNRQVSYVMSKLSREIMEYVAKFLSDKQKIMITEDVFFELKSADYVMGNNKEIIKRLVDDLRKKLSKSQLKIYVIGVNEKNREIEPIPRSRFRDERIEKISNGISEELRKEFGDIMIKILPIELSDNRMILLMIAEAPRPPLTSAPFKIPVMESH